MISASRGKVEITSARPLRELNGWRAMFDLRLTDDSVGADQPAAVPVPERPAADRNLAVSVHATARRTSATWSPPGGICQKP